MFKQKAWYSYKKGDPHSHSGANHNPARADERFLGVTQTHTAGKASCAYTAGSNGRWDGAIADLPAFMQRPERAPEPLEMEA